MEQAAIDIIAPVLEKAVMLASRYCTACDRDTVTSKDFEYALKYCARYTVGQDIGFVQDDDEEEEEEDDDIEIVEEMDDDAFTRYDGNDDVFLLVNQAVDTWDSWRPESPAERYLFNAINSNEHFVG